MKLIKNEKLEKINARLKEVEAKRDAIQSEVDEIEAALSQSVALYAMGEVDEKDIQAAKQLLHEKKIEFAEVEEMISRIRAVRKTVAIESIPFVKESRKKKVAAIQKKYVDQIEHVHKARAKFLEELAALGKIKNEVGSINFEYNDLMQELGGKGDVYGAAINERTVISGGFTSPTYCLGVDERTQKQSYASGSVPHGLGGN
ncbi:hypothetical protein [Sporosarcina sp. HYO08]|uniref:hypothetical protein n=1 Tax=Sporosarcina sp. HYO08 TaxID=1759557 RepID=UPI000796A66C|nr:hypothetical protein [Sporosarcina sp. HYO08]KXH87371.1 hypothetical protein AU377_02015 [Sporosarcina sp. HYO08]